MHLGAFRLQAKVDGLQRAARQLRTDHKGGEKRNAEARNGGVAHHQAVVDAQGSCRPHHDRPCPAGEAPVGVAPAVEDGIVVLQRARRARHSPRLQIGRRGDEKPPAGGEALGDQPRIAHRAMPDHRVIAFRGDIDEPVVQLQAELQAGMVALDG